MAMAGLAEEVLGVRYTLIQITGAYSRKERTFSSDLGPLQYFIRFSKKLFYFFGLVDFPRSGMDVRKNHKTCKFSTFASHAKGLGNPSQSPPRP